MPGLITSGKFLQDLDRLKSRKQIIKKVAKTLARLEADPSHPGLPIERIRNDPTAWSVRVDRRYRLSFEPGIVLAPGSLTGQENSSCCQSCHMMTSINIRDESHETAGPLPLTCRSELDSLPGLQPFVSKRMLYFLHLRHQVCNCNEFVGGVSPGNYYVGAGRSVFKCLHHRLNGQKPVGQDHVQLIENDHIVISTLHFGDALL